MIAITKYLAFVASLAAAFIRRRAAWLGDAFPRSIGADRRHLRALRSIPAVCAGPLEALVMSELKMPHSSSDFIPA
jgi:hypothetical protein